MSEVLILKKRKDFVRVAAKGVKVATSTLILPGGSKFICTRGLMPHRLHDNQENRQGSCPQPDPPPHARRRPRTFSGSRRPGVDYVLIGRYNTADCPFDKLKGDLCYGLKKLHKLLNPEEKKHEPATEKPVDLAD